MNRNNVKNITIDVYWNVIDIMSHGNYNLNRDLIAV